MREACRFVRPIGRITDEDESAVGEPAEHQPEEPDGLPGRSAMASLRASVIGRIAVEGGEHRQGPGPDGEPTIVQRIIDGEVDLIVNTPWGVGPRVDGYEIRTAAVMRGVPCMTTVQWLAAYVQGIEALMRGDIGVRSLQEHAVILRASRASQTATATGTAERTTR